MQEVPWNEATKQVLTPAESIRSLHIEANAERANANRAAKERKEAETKLCQAQAELERLRSAIATVAAAVRPFDVETPRKRARV